MSRLSERPITADVGVTRPHESASLHVTGRALYTDDIALRTPYLLHAHPVNAPHAHAMITRLDPKPAYDVPGVVRVLTADDVPGVNDAGTKHDEPLFPTEVMFRDQAVAWVLGESLEAARIGAAAVEVDYEPLPSIVTVVEAIEQESFQGVQPRMERGDVATGLAGSAHVFEGEIDFAGQEHFYLETHASLAIVDDDGQVFIQSSTQHPTETQEIVAHVLGLASHQVTVQCVRMGGGFGGKEMQPHGFAAVAALGARLTGRPVRIRLTRQQDMTMSGKRHGFHASWKVGFDDDGRLQALEATLTSDGGWSLDLSEPVMSRALCHIDNAYWIPHVRVDGRVAKTHKTSQTAFRGFGGPQGMLVIEDILGRVRPAARASIRPSCVGATSTRRDRRRRTASPSGTPSASDAPGTRCSRTSDFPQRRDEIARANAENPHSKRGLAITPVKFGISFNYTSFNQAGALVHVYKDGSVLINHGGTEMGQGLHTKMLQVAATALGLPIERVRLAPTRTDKVPNTSATAASSGADLNGAAVKDACDQILARLEPVRDRLGPTASWEDVVTDAYFHRIQLWAAGFYKTEGLSWDAQSMQRRAVQVLRVRRGRGRGVRRRVHRRLPGRAGRHRPRRRRQPVAAGRHRPDRGRLRPGRRVADPRGPALGRLGRAGSRPAGDPGGVDLQAAEPLGDAGRPAGDPARPGHGGRCGLRVEGGRRAAPDAGVLRARGAARSGGRVRLAGDLGRAGVTGHAGGGLLGDRGGAVRDGLAAGAAGVPGAPYSLRAGHRDRRARPRAAGGGRQAGRHGRARRGGASAAATSRRRPYDARAACSVACSSPGRPRR